MTNLEDTVLDVVAAFIRDEQLFTALDVSNKVKETIPHARHREVRDLVRNLYVSDMEPNGWAKTPIEVTLADGKKAEALLYHPLSAAWDLDKYDAQKRAQSSKPNVAPVPATVAADGTITVAPVTNVVGVTGVPTGPVPTAVVSPKQLWDQLFGTQPSLFPRKQ